MVDTLDLMKKLESLDIFSVPDFQDVYRREDIDESKFMNVWKLRKEGLEPS